MRERSGVAGPAGFGEQAGAVKAVGFAAAACQALAHEVAGCQIEEGALGRAQAHLAARGVEQGVKADPGIGEAGEQGVENGGVVGEPAGRKDGAQAGDDAGGGVHT